MRLLLSFLLAVFTTSIARAADDDLAVIIAIKRYVNAHDVAYADRDGEAMRDFAERALAIPMSRIIVVGDGPKGDGKATYADLRALFGTVIPQRLASGKAKRVWVYYSGHGVPGRGPQGAAEPYLLPSDGRPGAPEYTALKLEDVEQALSAAVRKHAPGAQVVLILDACFSGRSESETAVADAKGRALSPENSAGSVVQFVKRPATEELIVLAAARDDEIASWDREAQHGLFTDLLLQAFFKGVGDGGRVTVGGFESFARGRMGERLSLLFPGGGRRQQPDIRGARSLVLVDNAGTIVLDPGAQVQAMVQCIGLKVSPDAKAIGEFLASPLCARGCDTACRTALGERRRTLEQEADECVNLAHGIEALVKAKQPRIVLDAALKDLPQRCAEARGIALSAIAALETPPKVSDPAPKAPMLDPKRPAAGIDTTELRSSGSLRLKATINSKSIFATSVALTRDGPRIASIENGKIIALWDAYSGAIVKSFPGHNDYTSDITLSDDGRIFVDVGCDQRSTDSFDCKTGSIRVRKDGIAAYNIELDGAGPSMAVSFNGHVIAGSHSVGIKLWDFQSGKLRQTLRGYYPRGRFAITRDGRRVARAGFFDTGRETGIEVWNAKTGQVLYKMFHQPVASLDFSWDGSQLVVGGVDGDVRVYNAGSGTIENEFLWTGDKQILDFQRTVQSVSFFPNRPWIAAARNDGTIRIYNLNTRQQVINVPAYALGMKSVRVSNDGLTLVSAGCDDPSPFLGSLCPGGPIKIWGVEP